MTDPMFTYTTEYGLSFREQLVLEIAHSAVSLYNDWIDSTSIRSRMAESIVDLANMIYEETEDYDEEPLDDGIVRADD